MVEKRGALGERSAAAQAAAGRSGQRRMGDGVLLPAVGSPPGAACPVSQPHSLAGLCCSRHFLPNKSSGSRAKAPVGALPPPDPSPCPPAGSSTSLFFPQAFSVRSPSPCPPCLQAVGSGCDSPRCGQVAEWRCGRLAGAGCFFINGCKL